MIVLRMFGLSAILGGSAWIRARVAAVVKPFSVCLVADVVRGLVCLLFGLWMSASPGWITTNFYRMESCFI